MNRRTMLKSIAPAVAAAGMMARDGFASAKRPLGLEFLATCRDLLEKIRSNAADEMLEASHRIAETKKQGGKCYISWDLGHGTEYDIWPDRPGNTDIFTYGIPDSAGKGDLILANFYDERVKKHHDSGAFLISGSCSWGADNIGSELIRDEFQHMKYSPFADLWIELYATSYGALMNVPGEITPMGPQSGVVGMMTYWMMVADAARLLAADGVAFKVFGNEPPLSRNAPRVDTKSPAGQRYYDAAVKQQRALENEFDAIDRIATMAVHATLTGGRVYVYSRHERNLCGEATVRRGGLSMTFGVYGPPEKLMLMDDPLQQGLVDLSFRPTDKDIVIMGISGPDDPDDLASLDLFKKRGVGLASIGPATKNGVAPSGRSVPKETDIHIGGMADAYGLLAFPGVERKVAPTSGLINNQAFWAVCCQIAEQFIARTGTPPGIYMSGALKGGMEKLNEVKRVLNERGY